MKKVIIIEDEPAAINELKVLVSQEEDLEFIGEAGALEEAVALLRSQQPDLVFRVYLESQAVLIF